MVKLTIPNNLNWRELAAPVLIAFGMLGSMTDATAQSDIRSTVHNLSKSNTISGAVKATSETEVCVFCHTPHGANQSAKTPLWNRRGTTLPTYTAYSSSSLNATQVRDELNGVTGGSSVLCLSCHDGVVALGNVNVLRGKTNQTIALSNAGGAVTTMPIGKEVLTGYTRNLGTDLSNDHPISITYDDGLAGADGEMVLPSERSAVIGIRTKTNKPLLPLEPTGTGKAGQVQCATCHDPHIKKDKFLRLNRFQVVAPSATFDKDKDIICLACHTKLGITWAQSAHATSSADYPYKDDAADLRGFPRNMKVWEAACLNCHDTHTASGSRRLLREGTGGAPNALSKDFQAGTATRPLEKVSSIENTCYQCHTTQGVTGATILTVPVMTADRGVPDIKSEFDRAVHMPIKTSEQKGSGSFTENSITTNYNNINDKEAHDIVDANFTESQDQLGRSSTYNRHVECTDCHNPHRVIKNSLFNGLGSSTRRTHEPAATTLTELEGGGGNIASGVLRGTWGVEPVVVAMSTNWPQLPTFEVKQGDPKETSTLRSKPYLTREYQLCFKCHSNYANTDATTGYPFLGNTGGGTASGTNGMRQYTNVAAEFSSVNATDPPSSGKDQGETDNSGTACNNGNCTPTPSAPGGTNNHRSWHPVMWPTGRDKAERGSTSWSNIRAPFDVNVGTQTMHCSDCHGDPSSWTQGTGPKLDVVQGPHGSSKPFLLKGDWDLVVDSSPPTTGQTPSSPGVCGNCHNPTNSVSGFSGTTEGRHSWSGKDGVPCNYCHIAVPHGWKNKAFLVNLNCVGTESGEPSGYTNGCKGKTGLYSAAPYYRNALLRINEWRVSGNWAETACGDGSGKTWMTETCQEGW
jgi:hypothetical protein